MNDLPKRATCFYVKYLTCKVKFDLGGKGQMQISALSSPFDPAQALDQNRPALAPSTRRGRVRGKKENFKL